MLCNTYPDMQVVNVDKVSYCSRREHLKGLNVVSYETDINEMEKILCQVQSYVLLHGEYAFMFLVDDCLTK